MTSVPVQESCGYETAIKDHGGRGVVFYIRQLSFLDGKHDDDDDDDYLSARIGTRKKKEGSTIGYKLLVLLSSTQWG